MGTEGDKEVAYQYSSDTSMPAQDGGLQWSIGGVPLQQQLRFATLHFDSIHSIHFDCVYSIHIIYAHSIHPDSVHCLRYTSLHSNT